MSDGGLYRGHREDGCDYFDDVMGDNDVPAIFATPGGGLGEYESIKTEATPDGMAVRMHCRPPGCGQPRGIEITWAELFIIANAPQTGILPDGWARSETNASCYPAIQCRCGQPIAPMISPGWAGRQLNDALQANQTSQQALAQDPQVQRLQTMMRGGGGQQQPMQQQQGPPQGYPR